MNTMARTRAWFAEELHPTQEEPDEVTVAPKVPESPCTPRPRKNKQTMGPFSVSLRFSKRSVTEKGKAVTTKPDEDNKDLQALIAQIEA